jgi:hypothetical protein
MNHTSPSLETRKKQSDAKKGYKHTEEAKRKMSAARKGRPSTRKGISRTEEVKRKLSIF